MGLVNFGRWIDCLVYSYAYGCIELKDIEAVNG